jgi:hypothetical protein
MLPAFQQNSAMLPAFQQNSAMLPAFQQNSAMLPAFQNFASVNMNARENTGIDSPLVGQSYNLPKIDLNDSDENDLPRNQLQKKSDSLLSPSSSPSGSSSSSSSSYLPPLLPNSRKNAPTPLAQLCETNVIQNLLSHEAQFSITYTGSLKFFEFITNQTGIDNPKNCCWIISALHSLFSHPGYMRFLFLSLPLVICSYMDRSFTDYWEQIGSEKEYFDVYKLIALLVPKGYSTAFDKNIREKLSIDSQRMEDFITENNISQMQKLESKILDMLGVESNSRRILTFTMLRIFARMQDAKRSGRSSIKADNDLRTIYNICNINSSVSEASAIPQDDPSVIRTNMQNRVIDESILYTTSMKINEATSRGREAMQAGFQKEINQVRCREYFLTENGDGVVSICPTGDGECNISDAIRIVCKDNCMPAFLTISMQRRKNLMNPCNLDRVVVVNGIKYVLASVITSHGKDADSGHYTSSILDITNTNNDSVTCFNDNKVSSNSWNEVRKSIGNLHYHNMEHNSALENDLIKKYAKTSGMTVDGIKKQILAGKLSLQMLYDIYFEFDIHAKELMYIKMH